MPVASTVTVEFKANTAKFENGLKRAKKAGKAFGPAIAGSMRLAGAAAAGLAVGLTALTKASFATVDAQTKAARTLGTTQRVLAGLSLAADISGVSVQSFEKALKKQSKAIVDANDGLLTQKKAFDRLGLSASDLINLPVEEAFKSITTALGKVENKTLKVGIASDIFGAKNSDLINILDLGAEGIQGYIDKVDQLGVALSVGQTKAIEDANDSVTIFKKSFEGLGNQLAAQFAPAVARAAAALTNFVISITSNVERLAINVRNILGLQADLNVLSLNGLRQEYALTQSALTKLREENAKTQKQLEGKRVNKGSLQYEFLTKALAEGTAEADRLTKHLDDIIAQQKILSNPPPRTLDNGGDAPVGDAAAIKFQKDFDAATRATATASEALQAKLAEIRNNLENNPLWTEELAGRQAKQAVEAYVKQLKGIDGAMGAIAAKQKTDFDAAFSAFATPAEKLDEAFAEIRANLESNPFWTPELAQRQGAAAVDAYLTELARIEAEASRIVDAQKAEFDSAFENFGDPVKVAEVQLQKAFADIRRNLETNPFWTEELAQRQGQAAVDAYLSELQRIDDEANDIFKNMTEFQRAAFTNMQGILADYLIDPFEDGMKGMLSSFVDMLRQMVAQLLASQILEYFFGFFGGSVSIGARAIGGPVEARKPLLVGENGPEVFTPGATGYITPVADRRMDNFMPGASGAAAISNVVTINQENYFNGEGGLDTATLIPILNENNRKVKGEFLDELNRGKYE